MCAQFEIASDRAAVIRQLLQEIETFTGSVHVERWKRGLKGLPSDAETPPGRALPYGRAPAFRSPEGGLTLDLLQFSLIPHWSRERRVKFATHNARLESVDERTGRKVWIHEKPTWRAAFLRQHCVIPMGAFFEAVHHGPYAHHMIRLQPRVEGRVLFAAGIWDQWNDPASGEVLESFSLLTDAPIPFVQECGHDRSPIFLKGPDALRWLEVLHERPADAVAFLRANRQEPELQVIVDRALKSAGRR